ncbi:hypothetical protein SNEBB_008455 [Seison nebaliae]|nr:hypothetical protein SNEBB_008455 [Seison nebaliae]
MTENDLTNNENEDELFGGDEENCASKEDRLFDSIIGTLEDIVMEENFRETQFRFMEMNYHHFDIDNDESKFIYTDLHEKYSNLIETFITNELINRIPDFHMLTFQQLLINRHSEVDDDLLELLKSFQDFIAFQQMMKDYHRMKINHEQNPNLDLISSAISITPLQIDDSPIDIHLDGDHLNLDEEDDDDQIDDLNNSNYSDLLVTGRSIVFNGNENIEQ